MDGALSPANDLGDINRCFQWRNTDVGSPIRLCSISSQDLLRQAGQTPLLHFLDPDFHDNLSRATQGFSDRVVSWFRSVLDNIHSVAGVCGLLGAVFILSSNIWCMIALFVSSSIILFTRKPIARLELEQDRAAARPNRTQTAWAARLYERVNSPEVRLFSLQRWLLSKWENAYRQLATVEIGSLKRKTAWNALANLSSVFGYCVIVFIAAQVARNGDPEKIAGIFTGPNYRRRWVTGISLVYGTVYGKSR